jgi:hypothetical protein
MRFRELLESEGYNIQAKYDKFNLLYFEGKLPKVPVSFEPLKGVAGVVKYTTRRLGAALTAREVRMGKENLSLNPETVRLILSNRFKRSEEDLDSTLLHEMIHVFFLMVANDLRENHGWKFERMRIEISRASGIDVTRTEAMGDRELTDETKLARVGVLVFTRKDGRVSFMLISSKMAVDKSNELRTIWESKGQYYTGVALYVVSTPIWTRMASKYPIQRAMKKIYSLDAAAYDDLKKNGQVLFNLNLI